jgi:hypothetical protein
MIKRIITALFLVLLVTQFVHAGTGCKSLWGDRMCLTVHSDLDLGVIDASIYQGATPQGGGSFQALSSLSNVVTVVRDGWNFEWVLEVRVESASPLVDLTKFSWRGGDQHTYTTFPAVDQWMTVSSGRGGAVNYTTPIDYRYLPDTDDRPGEYQVTLRYRVSVSWWWGTLYSVNQDVLLSFKADTWMVLSVHDSVDLGTIDGSLYDIDHGFSSLESQDNGVFVIGNSPAGWELTLGVASTSAPLGFQGDLLADLYWRTDEGAYHAASGLDTSPVLIASQPTAGRATHSVDYRYQVDTGDIPGDYTVRLRYTAVSK